MVTGGDRQTTGEGQQYEGEPLAELKAMADASPRHQNTGTGKRQQEEDQVGPSKTQLPSKIEYVSLLNKAVTMRDAANLPDGKDVRIS